MLCVEGSAAACWHMNEESKPGTPGTRGRLNTVLSKEPLHSAHTHTHAFLQPFPQNFDRVAFTQNAPSLALAQSKPSEEMHTKLKTCWIAL